MPRFILVMGFALLTASAVSASSLRIGSRDFPESVLMAEILSTAIESETDIEVERKFNLGGVKICLQSMQDEALDFYPDYTGSLLHNLLGEQEPKDYLRNYLASSLKQEHQLSISDNLGFDNSFVLVLRKTYADKYGLKTISNLSELIKKNPSIKASIRAAFKHSFIKRPDGYKQLREVYGLDFKRLIALEYNIAYQQLKAQRVDLIDAFSTDARLIDDDLTVLVDDRNALLSYDSVYVYREALIAKHPELEALVSKLSNILDNDTVIKLNQRVRDGESYSDVARDFLQQNLAIKSKAPSKSRKQEDIDLLLRAIWQHLLLTFTALGFAAVSGVLIAILISYCEPLAKAILGLASVAQVIPSLALLALLIPVFGLGFNAAIAALFIYALLPIIQNTYTGIKSIEAKYLELAASLTLDESLILTRVKLPLALPMIIAGLRTSAVICVGAATLATFVGAGGLGDLIKAGIDLNNNKLILMGAIPASVLALFLSYILGLMQSKPYDPAKL